MKKIRRRRAMISATQSMARVHVSARNAVLWGIGGLFLIAAAAVFLPQLLGRTSAPFYAPGPVYPLRHSERVCAVDPSTGRVRGVIMAAVGDTARPTHYRVRKVRMSNRGNRLFSLPFDIPARGVRVEACEQRYFSE